MLANPSESVTLRITLVAVVQERCYLRSLLPSHCRGGIRHEKVRCHAGPGRCCPGGSCRPVRSSDEHRFSVHAGAVGIVDGQGIACVRIVSLTTCRIARAGSQRIVQRQAGDVPERVHTIGVNQPQLFEV